MQTYVISLPRSQERRASIARQLQALGLSYEIIDGVEGRSLRPEDLAQYSPDASISSIGRELVPEEIGCALSHVQVYQRVVAGNQEALVLEDDASLDPGLLEVLDGRARYPSDWELILLSHHGSRLLPWGRTQISPRHKVARFLSSNVFCTTGYLIHVEGARRLLNCAYPIRQPSDSLTGRFRETGLSLYGLAPQCVSSGTFPSSIWYDRELQLRGKIKKRFF